MKRNVGRLDRTVRIVAGLLVAIGGLVAVAGYWKAGLMVGVLGLVVGTILLVTGTTQQCPVYAGIGVDTAKEQQ